MYIIVGILYHKIISVRHNQEHFLKSSLSYESNKIYKTVIKFCTNPKDAKDSKNHIQCIFKTILIMNKKLDIFVIVAYAVLQN